MSGSDVGERGFVRLGIISDTHDLLRESAISALQGVDEILHMGDVCCPEILDRLRQVAPVHAVRGNMDFGKWPRVGLPRTEALEIGGCWIYMVHDLQDLDLEPVGRFRVILHGHTHMPEVREAGRVLYFNPGSAGPRRGARPISLGFLEIREGEPKAEWMEIAGD